MFERILLPLDGSSLAECVLPHAVTLARCFDSTLILLRALERQQSGRVVEAVDTVEWEMLKSEAEAYLKSISDRLQQLDLPAEQIVAEGAAAERILGVADEQDIDLIILSSHGASGLSGWNINSTVQKVILRCYVPALIVRAYREVPQDWSGLRYKRLLVPLDGSKRAELVLPLASKLASCQEATLVLAHVVTRPEVDQLGPLPEEIAGLVDKLSDWTLERAEEYMADVQSRTSDTADTHTALADHDAAQLHELVKDEDIDLVILSAHGHSGEAKWPYGSVALNFIAYGTKPLLIMQDISKGEVPPTEAERAAKEEPGH